MSSSHSTITTTRRTVSTASEPTTLLSPGPIGITGGTTLRTVGVAPAQFSSVQYVNGAVDGTAIHGNVSVASEPPTTLLSSGQIGITGGTTLRTVGVANVQYVNGAVDGTAIHGNVRYLVPVSMQRASESYMMVNQTPQVLTPVYVQNVQNVQRMQRISVSSQDEFDSVQNTSINGEALVYSQSPSPVKSPEPPEPVESSVQQVTKFELKTDFKEDSVAKLDTRFFGELLAEVYRKNCDIHTCVLEHVSKIRGGKLLQDYKEKEDIEHLIPKEVSELTKQQIRYLLQTRMTADMTMRMLLSTFSSLKEDLVHLQEDLRRLESEKEQLERDVSFKAEQGLQYNRLLESVRENNRQLQISLKESTTAQRNMEAQLMNNRSLDSSKDFRIKDLEGSKRALEQENELLRQKLNGQSSAATLNSKTQDLSRHYEQLLKELREEKDKEIKNMRSQMVKIQTEYTTERSSDRSLELRITELISKLEQHESTIKRQEEELRRLRLEKSSSSGSTTQTVITKRYETQYPILGLLSDDYHYTPPPSRESKTIVIKKTGEMTKKEYSK